MAMPDVFSIRHTTVEAYLEPIVHEVKVQRADLLADLRRATKRAGLPAARRRVLVRDQGRHRRAPTRSRPNAACSSPTRRRPRGGPPGAEAADADAASRSGWRWRGRRRSKAGASKTRNARSATTRRRRRPDDAADRRRMPSRRPAPTPRRPADRCAPGALGGAGPDPSSGAPTSACRRRSSTRLSPGGFLFVRYLIMPVAAAILLCCALRHALAARLARRCLRAAPARPGRPPAARRPGDLRHPLVDRVLELADPRLRAGLHPADPALARPRGADARAGGRRRASPARRARLPLRQAVRRPLAGRAAATWCCSSRRRSSRTTRSPPSR